MTVAIVSKHMYIHVQKQIFFPSTPGSSSSDSSCRSCSCSSTYCCCCLIHFVKAISIKICDLSAVMEWEFLQKRSETIPCTPLWFSSCCAATAEAALPQAAGTHCPLTAELVTSSRICLQQKKKKKEASPCPTERLSQGVVGGTVQWRVRRRERGRERNEAG